MTDKAVALLRDLVGIPSPSGGEAKAAAFLVSRARRLGFDAERDPAGNAVASAGDPDAKRTVVLLGHLDTVPGWIPIRVEGGALWGRGAVDAKGALVAFLLAAAEAMDSLQQTRLLVIGAVREESDSAGARFLAARMRPPTYAVIGEPSGWNGITLGYKGYLGLHYALAQPAAHSAGESPPVAEHAVAFWNRVVADAAERSHGAAIRFDRLDPALRSIETQHDGLTERVSMRVGFRLPPQIDLHALRSRVASWSRDATLEWHGGDPAFRADRNTPLVRAFFRAVRSLGGTPRLKLKSGTSDMNVVGPAWRCPIVAYGPGDAALDHTPEERIGIEAFLAAIDVLTVALHRLTAPARD